jgi:hypothetical protein
MNKPIDHGPILDAEDALEVARGCIDCLLLATSGLSEDDRHPMNTTDIASTKIDEAIALLKEYLKASGFGSDEAYAAAEERLREYHIRPERIL